MLVFRADPLGIEHFSSVKTFFCCNKFAQMLTTEERGPQQVSEDPGIFLI